ncbi:MAG TPA: DUF2012 domain-containing protein, partial [Acidobacteriaceae bacterium]
MKSAQTLLRSSSYRRIASMVTLALVALFSSVPQLAHAQATAQVTGTVTDPSAAIVPGAAVVLKNTGTNATRTVTVNSDGIYTFSDLQPGSYTVTATSAGFSPFTADVTVTVGGHFTVDAKLSVTNTATVEVSSDQSAQVNTATAEVSQVITQEQVSQLPSLTRNPYDFVALSGNISSGDASANGMTQNGADRGVNFSLNGQRNSGTEILLDGVENITVFGDAVGTTVPLDAVQEYRVITNNFSPEYGRASGGVVAVATKSGTNTLHGTIWEFNRIAATTANTVTNAQAGTPKGEYTRNQFGAAVGGPIWKDRLFFFGSAEFTRVRSAASSIGVVPSAELLAASPANVQSFFSTYGPAVSGTTSSQTTNLQAGPVDPVTNIQSPLYDPAVYPTLQPGTPVFNNVSFVAPQDAGGGLPQNTYNVVGRADYTLGQSTQAFFRFVDYHEIDQAGAAFASPYSQYDVGESNIGQAYLLSVAHEFNQSLTTLSKLSFSRN